MAAERRGNLEGPGVALQEEWDGVLLWEIPPEAGREAVLLYNRDSGALRCTPTLLTPPPPNPFFLPHCIKRTLKPRLAGNRLFYCAKMDLLQVHHTPPPDLLPTTAVHSDRRL